MITKRITKITLYRPDGGLAEFTVGYNDIIRIEHVWPDFIISYSDGKEIVAGGFPYLIYKDKQNG